jgi:hypothetical protein
LIPLHARLLEGSAKTLLEAGSMKMEDLPALKSYISECERSLRPCPSQTLMAYLAKLLSHYPQPDLPDGVNDARWDDWMEDFAEVPEDWVRAACASWRRSAQRFAPSPGQLLELTNGYKVRAVYLKRAKDVQFGLVGDHL